MRTLAAFVAHSFAPEDEPKIRPILAQLDAFHEMGFVWKSGEPAEADRVSEKIRRRILDAQVFIGILTHKHPVFNLRNTFKDAWKLFSNKLQPSRWTPPGWVIQESGFALALERKVILFVEPNLDFPALQGDLEYVPYDYLHPEDAVRRVSQMISKLIAEQAGIRVATVVENESEGQEKEKKISPTTESKETTKESQPSQPGLAEIYDRFILAINEKDLAVARRQLQAALELIQKDGPNARGLSWRCHCLVVLYRAGDVPAFQELKQLETENPTDPTPTQCIGDALASFKEHSEAANYYKRAAELSTSKEDKDSLLLDCANSLIEAKLLDQAEPILALLLREAQIEVKTQATEKLYNILKASDRYFEAFGTAEVLLHENPGLANFRFSLGLDYHRRDLHDLFLHHFNLLKQKDPDRSDVMHNVALAFSECKLPIASVGHYKRAIELGGTLAASNLGHKYIDAGMVDEASVMLKEALKKADVEPDVPRCLAEIAEKQEKEGERFNELMEKVNKQKEFLVALGRGLQQVESPAMAGRWRMPFGEIHLDSVEGRLEGETEVIHEPSGYGSLSQMLSGITASGIRAFGSTHNEPKQVRIYSVTGSITGSVCRFTTNVKPKETGPFGTIGREESIHGYLIFNPDGQSARYAELKDGNLSNLSLLKRVGA